MLRCYPAGTPRSREPHQQEGDERAHPSSQHAVQQYPESHVQQHVRQHARHDQLAQPALPADTDTAAVAGECYAFTISFLNSILALKVK